MKLRVVDMPKEPDNCMFSHRYYIGEVPNNEEPLYYSDNPYKVVYRCKLGGDYICENTSECPFLDA